MEEARVERPCESCVEDAIDSVCMLVEDVSTGVAGGHHTRGVKREKGWLSDADEFLVSLEEEERGGGSGASC